MKSLPPVDPQAAVKSTAGVGPAEHLNALGRILVIAVPALGDILLCTPLITALRQAASNARLDVLVRKNHGIVLEGNRDVDGVIEVSKQPSAGELLTLTARLFRKYDLVVSNSTSDRAAFYSLIAGRQRISLIPPGIAKPAWKRRVYDRYAVADAEHCHTLLKNNRLGELIGLRVKQDITPPRSENSESVLSAILGHDWKERKFAVIHPTPALPFKRWQVAGWRAIAEHLRQRDVHILLTGGAGADELGYLRNEIRFPAGSVTDLAGKLRLGDISALLEKCAVYIGVDTVVTHIAAAIGAPTVALFGPTNPEVWGPWPRGYDRNEGPFVRCGSQRVKNVYVLQWTDVRVPCNGQGCPHQRHSHGDCLQCFGVPEAIHAIDRQLS